MTKFQQLQEEYKRVPLRSQEYQLQAFTLGAAFLHEFRDVLECQPNEVYLFPVLSPRQIGTQYSAAGAMEWDNDDGSWQFAVGLLLEPITELFLRIYLRRR